MAGSLILKGRGAFRKNDGQAEEQQIFASLAAAEACALTHPKAKPGQILAVTGAAATDAYQIQWDRSLKKINCDGTDTATLSAYDVSFDQGGFSNAGDALASLFYVKPAVSLTGGATYEIGQTISSVTLHWTISGSKPLISQSLNQGIGNITPLTTRTYTHSGQTITANRTYTITVADDANTASSSTTVAFSPKRYWGVSNKTVLSDAEIIALSSEFSTNRTQSRVLDCTGGAYLWFVWESSYGAGSFTVNGLPNTAWTVTTRDMANASGATRNVRMSRSDHLLFGNAYTIAVS